MTGVSSPGLGWRVGQDRWPPGPPRQPEVLCHLAQVIFDETLQKCLDSYLRYAPRKFDEWVAPSPEVADMQRRLHRSVFLTFLRMSTHKESKVSAGGAVAGHPHTLGRAGRTPDLS